MRKPFSFILLLFFLEFFLSPLMAGPIYQGSPETIQQYKYAMGLINRRLFDEALNVLSRIIDDPNPFENRDSAIFWKAECFYRLGKFREAISAFENFYKEYPESVFRDRAAYGLGWAYSKDNNPKSAVEAFARVSPRDPKLRIEALLKMGYIMTKFGMDPKEVAEVFEELLSNPGLSSEQKFDAYMQVGVQRFQEALYDAAATQFVKSLEFAQPAQKPNVLLYLAESLFRNKKFSEAISRFQEISKASSTPDISDKANYSLAWCLIKSGKPSDAVPLLIKSADNPSSTTRKESVKNLVELLMNLHRFRDAIVWMEKGARVLSGDEAIEMEYLRGLALSRLGEFPAAIDVFKAFIKNHPKNSRCDDARYQFSLLYITMGKFFDAIKELEPLLRVSTAPQTKEKALYRVGECYFNLGNMENAKNSFERLIKEYPKGSARLDALFQLGEIEYLSGNHNKALDAFSAIGTTNEELSGQAIFRAGEVLMKAGRFSDAVERFEEYLNRFSKGTLREDARFKIGLCELERKDKGRALAAFSELRESTGYFRQEARFQIGEIAREMGNYPLAIQHFKAILSEDPKNPLASRADRAVGICLYKMKDFEGAQAVFKKIIKAGSATDNVIPECYLWLGRAMIALGKTEDGILEVLKIVVLFPKSPLLAEAYAEAARGYESLGKLQKSAKMWRELQKIRRSGPLFDEAQKSLKK
ncbi:tetratricopeptide repeat protein [bacterium]|nr:tetratricopeptide repeat protein [bacterium]